MGGVEIAAYLDVLDNDGVLLADAAERAGLTAAVPGCPGWRVRDLVRHQAYVHDWAARHVRERLPELIDGPAEADILAGGPPDGELVAAYRRGHAALVATLRSAEPDVACATFMPAPSPLAFYAFLWNRCDPDRAHVTVAGDPSILVPWPASVRITY
jgi:uncharacterized protein (TIGR03083 family)